MNYKYGSSSDVFLIGPKDSGKTTYLAALACFPHQHRLGIDGLSVQVNSESADGLRKAAENLIKKGQPLPASFSIVEYEFIINFPSINKLSPQTIYLIVKDSWGEVFNKLLDNTTSTQSQIEDLFKAQGLIIMISDWQGEEDKNYYLPRVTKLCQYLENNHERGRKVRIAFVMNKCERGEIWPGRLEASEDLFAVRLPFTYDYLCKFFKRRRHQLHFFACSSFGVLGSQADDFDPRPNRFTLTDGTPYKRAHRLRDPNRWEPFGLLSPIYWLTKGQLLHDQHL